MSKHHVLVQGATSELGLHIVNSFSRCPNISVRFGFENAEKLAELKKSGKEWVYLDLSDANTLPPALEGIDTVVLIPPYESNRVSLCYRFIDKCSRLGVKHIVLISVNGASTQAFPWAKQMFEVEHKIMKSGLKYNIIRTSLFQETLLIEKESLKREDSFYLPMSDASFAPASMEDVADLICKVATNQELHNKVFSITGPELITAPEIAKILSEKLGKKVEFQSLLNSDFKKKLKALGCSDVKIESLLELMNWYDRGNGFSSKDFEEVTGRKPKSFAEFAEQHKREILA